MLKRIGSRKCRILPEENEVLKTGEKLAEIPVTQLATMKLMVNQVYENQGLHTTQLLGCILDGSMRHTPEAMKFVETAAQFGVQQAIKQRDAPFHDYSQADEMNQVPNYYKQFKKEAVGNTTMTMEEFRKFWQKTVESDKIDAALHLTKYSLHLIQIMMEP
ncbi:unnamed protein product [Adineta ricciae]|uniref:Uncharacterized protein n=1 Tax=Adineta ricciae TaxID=249248 RepID=A0A815H2W8_ADIRI|nr:unnamed protein product [Adineta ricciae]